MVYFTMGSYRHLFINFIFPTVLHVHSVQLPHVKWIGSVTFRSCPCMHVGSAKHDLDCYPGPGCVLRHLSWCFDEPGRNLHCHTGTHFLKPQRLSWSADVWLRLIWGCQGCFVTWMHAWDECNYHVWAIFDQRSRSMTKYGRVLACCPLLGALAALGR